MIIKIIRAVLFVLGVILIIDTSVLLLSGYNFSKLFSAFFGCGLIAASVFDILLSRLNSHIPLIIFRSLFIIFVLSFIILEAFIISSANHSNKKGDAVIVLGAGLIGRSPNALLALRLDTAVRFLNDNPQAVCVVSGGQGKDEPVSEAEAMREYLLERGIAKSRILMEDKSTSTNENFEFSKRILAEYFKNKSYTCVYTTNSFHSFRAGLIAKRRGVETSPNSAPTIWYTRNNYYIREYFAMIKYILLGE